MIKRRPRIRTTTEEVLSNLYHLERNKIIGEADDLVQSKDPNPVISTNAASGSSPRDVDVSDRIERTPCQVLWWLMRVWGPSTPRDLHFREVLAPLGMTGVDSWIY